MINIQISTQRIKYDITLEHKISVLRGNSGTGKTTLASIIHYCNSNGNHRNILISSPKPLIVLDNRYYKYGMQELTQPSIVVIDEACEIFNNNEGIDYLKYINDTTPHYFIIITRKRLSRLPLSAGAFLEFVYENGVNRTHIRFPQKLDDINKKPTEIITEDEKSSYLFIKERFNLEANYILSAGSKSKLKDKVKYICSNDKYHIILLIYDYCGIGDDIESLSEVIDVITNANIMILDWYSFEYYLLMTSVIKNKIQIDLLNQSNEEIYFEHLLKSIIKYHKSPIYNTCIGLAPCGLCENNKYCTIKQFCIENSLIYGKLKQLKDVLENNPQKNSNFL